MAIWQPDGEPRLSLKGTKMQNFDYQRRTFITFGRGRENEVGSLVKFEGGRRVLLHYAPDALRKQDLLDRIKRSLDRAGLEVFELIGNDNQPTRDLVYHGIIYCRQEQIDFILAVGSNGVIDSAKAIGAGALYAGDFWDFFSGLREPVHSLPVGVIVTSTDTGAECSSVCMMTHFIEGVPRKFAKNSPTFLPRFAIINPELSLNMPARHTVLGAMNTLAFVLESYFTNTTNVQMTDELCEGVLRTIVNMLPRIIEDPNDYDARANLMLAGTLAQNGMCSLGRETDNAPHLLEGEISSHYDTDPALGLAVILPAWLSYCLHHNVMRMSQFAQKVFGVPVNFNDPVISAYKGIESLRVFLMRCNMPQNFADMGLQQVNIHNLVENLVLDYGPTIGTYVKLDANACESIYTMAYTYRHTTRTISF